MNKRTYRPLMIATVIWVLITFVWTPLWLGYIGRILVQIFDNSQSQFWIALGSFLGTNLGEVVFPLGLYFFVVKPYVKTPIINTRSSNRYRWVVLTILIIGTYFLLVPQFTYEYQVASHLIMGATYGGPVCQDIFLTCAKLYSVMSVKVRLLSAFADGLSPPGYEYPCRRLL